MAFSRVAVIMAGGSGERFWPVSTRLRPKQFLKLASPDQTLLSQAVDRAISVAGPDGAYIATGLHLVDPSGQDCPQLQSDNILAEPAKRNTAGCLVWVAANLIARNPDTWSQISMAVLTADQRINTAEQFLATVNQAMTTAESTGGLVTIGIPPTRPETGFGYVECGEPEAGALRVIRFREKPDVATAEEFCRAGNFLWNSGMFFWTLSAFMAALELAQPEMAAKTRTIAGQLAAGDHAGANATFESLPNLSIDYALMEKADQVYVVPAQFDWDDLGSWDALSRSLPLDESGNVLQGKARQLDSAECVIYNESSSIEVAILGLEGIAVVVTDGQVMVIPKDMAQDVKRLRPPD